MLLHSSFRFACSLTECNHLITSSVAITHDMARWRSGEGAVHGSRRDRCVSATSRPYTAACSNLQGEQRRRFFQKSTYTNTDSEAAICQSRSTISTRKSNTCTQHLDNDHIMSLSIRSFTISLKPGEPTFKWDPSRKWTTESVGDFIAIRDREFEKLGKELKGKFDRTEDKAAMKLKLDLASTQQDLAERIKKPC
jgi:hypothetical protein